MRVGFAALAGAVSVARSNVLDLAGVFDRLEASRFPAQMRHFYVVVRFDAGEGECGTVHHALVRVEGPAGESLFELRERFTVDAVRSREGGWTRRSRPGAGGAALRAYGLHGLVFPEPGVYTVAVLVDGRRAASVRLTVAAAAAVPVVAAAEARAWRARHADD